MKTNFRFWMMGAALLCLTMMSCNIPMSKDGYVKDFAEFVEDVEANGANYTLKDWERADDRYENYTEDYYERFADKLTPEDQKALGRCAAKYAKARAASAIKGLSDDIEEGANFMKGYAEEIDDDMNDVVNQMIEEMEEISWDVED